VTSGHRGQRSLYGSPHKWHRGQAMNALRALRRAADLSQREFAALIDVPLNTFRMWDSGLRPTPSHLIQRAALAVADDARNTARLSLDQLAREFGVHERTLRAAARTGRLEVTFSARSAFGRPIRLATRTAVQAFMKRDYRRFSGQSPAMAPLPSIPRDYDARLKRLRRRLRLTQHELARRIGAANKVVYQWESRQRTPSPVFWQRVEALRATRLRVRCAHISSTMRPHDSSLLTPTD
jgi:DNA-binding transcriptional regulator YiaG